jgi:uncharacterized DUF497 family protein
MRFEWDENKNRQNLAKHGVRFETATLAFDDPCSRTKRDPLSCDEERWITLGAIGVGSVLFVVHTWSEDHAEEVTRIISARAATPRERKAYEETDQGTEKRYRRDTRHAKRRD